MIETVGWVYEFDVKNIRKKPIEYKELLKCLENDGFKPKKEYEEIRKYLMKLQKKQKSTGNHLFDLF